jgi:hypothetical protein
MPTVRPEILILQERLLLIINPRLALFHLAGIHFCYNARTAIYPYSYKGIL